MRAIAFKLGRSELTAEYFLALGRTVAAGACWRSSCDEAP
jgi:hypothetical protein